MPNEKESLLERAKKVTRKNSKTMSLDSEHIELAVEWARGKISYTQVKEVLGRPSPTSVYSFLARALKKHIEDNHYKLSEYVHKRRANTPNKG